MRWRERISAENKRRPVIAEGRVVTEPYRCVQRGICNYNCPIGIDARHLAWMVEPVIDNDCLTCGECVARCPRVVLRSERTNIFSAAEAPEWNMKQKVGQPIGENV